MYTCMCIIRNTACWTSICKATYYCFSSDIRWVEGKSYIGFHCKIVFDSTDSNRCDQRLSNCRNDIRQDTILIGNVLLELSSIKTSSYELNSSSDVHQRNQSCHKVKDIFTRTCDISHDKFGRYEGYPSTLEIILVRFFHFSLMRTLEVYHFSFFEFDVVTCRFTIDQTAHIRVYDERMTQCIYNLGTYTMHSGCEYSGTRFEV